ncbi:MAG: helix-turn-helix transcriptional regulator [Spirochaetota bacterium]
MTLYEIGNEIRKIRKQKNMTQEMLCKIGGISRPTLSKIEQGQFGTVSVRALDKILMAMGYELSLQPRNIVGLPPLQDD